jgi:uncharacterized protein YrrD
MVEAGEHHNKLLISITNGKKLGEVRDLYLDHELTKVVAVQAGSEGFITRQALAIPRSHIHVYGQDAWLIAGDDTVVRLESIAGFESFVMVTNLRGREIQTEGGTRIGTIGDVILDGEARVLGFTLQRVYVQGPLEARKAIARSAITAVGGKDGPMLTILEQAEAETMELE